MPIPALIGASLISGATSSLGSIINGMAQARENARARDFSREMFDKQVAYQNSINQQQMAYQDKVNQENRDWSNETAVRQRIEDAGYNPYLYNGQASASSVGSANSANLGASVSPMSPTANPAPQFGNALISFMDSYNNAYDTLRKQRINAVVDKATGGTGNVEAGLQKNALLSAELQVKIQQEEFISKHIQNITDNMPVYGDDGQPLTDLSTGEPLSLKQASALTEYKEKTANLEKVNAEIENLFKQGKIIDIDILTKQYNLDNLLPQQFKLLESEINQINAQIRLTNAQRQAVGSQILLNLASANNQNSQATNNRAMLPGIKFENSPFALDRKGRKLQNESAMAYEHALTAHNERLLSRKAFQDYYWDRQHRIISGYIPFVGGTDTALVSKLLK